ADPKRKTLRLPKSEAAAPRPPAAGPRVRALLMCDPFPPVPVRISPVTTMGRDATCDLVLPHTSVSRVHAVVRVVGDELVFEDRSSYGSYVNGQRLMSATIAPGDALMVGPYEIQ